MKKVVLAFTALSIAMTSLNSCNKNSSTNTPTVSNDAPTVPVPSDAFAAFAAVMVSSTQTVAGITVPVQANTAAAWFGTATTHVDGGNVTCESTALTNISNNYIFKPTTATASIDLTTPIDWSVSGNSANGVAAFSKTDYGFFPTISDIANTGDVSTTTTFTLTASGLNASGADSVIFNVAGPSGHVTKVRPAGTSACTFSAAEMGTVGTGSGIIQIAPYSVSKDVTTTPGKTYYFVRESCANKLVTFK